MKKQNDKYKNILLGTAFGDAVLYLLFRGESELHFVWYP